MIRNLVPATPLPIMRDLFKVEPDKVLNSPMKTTTGERELTLSDTTVMNRYFVYKMIGYSFILLI